MWKIVLHEKNVVTEERSELAETFAILHNSLRALFCRNTRAKRSNECACELVSEYAHAREYFPSSLSRLFFWF